MTPSGSRLAFARMLARRRTSPVGAADDSPGRKSGVRGKKEFLHYCRRRHAELCSKRIIQNCRCGIRLRAGLRQRGNNSFFLIPRSELLGYDRASLCDLSFVAQASVPRLFIFRTAEGGCATRAWDSPSRAAQATLIPKDIHDSPFARNKNEILCLRSKVNAW